MCSFNTYALLHCLSKLWIYMVSMWMLCSFVVASQPYILQQLYKDWQLYTRDSKTMKKLFCNGIVYPIQKIQMSVTCANKASYVCKQLQITFPNIFLPFIYDHGTAIVFFNRASLLTSSHPSHALKILERFPMQHDSTQFPIYNLSNSAYTSKQCATRPRELG